MQQLFKYVILLFLFSSFSEPSMAQSDRDEFVKKFQYGIIKGYQGMSEKARLDTTRFYTFAIKLEVVKTDENNCMLQNISVSDSVAHDIYQDMSFFNNLDYGPLMEGRDSAIFIIPHALWISAGPNRDYRNPSSAVAKTNFDSIFLKFTFQDKQPKGKTLDYIYLRPMIGELGGYTD